VYHKICLLNPPSVFPAFPQLGVSIIYQSLVSKHNSVEYIDLNLISWEKKLSSEYIRSLSGKKIHNSSDLQWYKSNRKFCENQIDEAVITIKNSGVLITDYIRAALTIRKTLKLISVCKGIMWSVSGVQYDNKIDNFIDLIRVVNDQQTDFFIEDFNELLKDFVDKSFEIFCVSISYSSQIIPSLKIIKLLKTYNENITIIVGGSYATYFRDEIEKLMENERWIDYLVLHNGEETILQLIDSIIGDKTNPQIDNVIYLEKQNVVKSCAINPMISNSDTLIPFFKSEDLNRYFSPKRVLPMIVSKGCYYGKCSFCSHHYNYGPFGGYMNKNIVESLLDMYVLEYHAEMIYFVDEALEKSMIETIADYIIIKEYSITWILETRAEKFFDDEEFLLKIKRSGCILLSFGIESANEKVLSNMNKGLSFSVFKSIIRKMKKIGIASAATFIIGFPGEKVKELNETFNEILINSDLKFFGISEFALMKYSPIYLAPKAYELKIGALKDYLTQQYSFKMESSEDFMKYFELFRKNDMIRKRLITSNTFLNRTHLSVLTLIHEFNEKDIDE
jgi:radical SAM superfamily enzyme YgiQ (UPF0313 family)